MGIFFKKMSGKEIDNWGKGCIFGFYTFLITLFINQTYNYILNSYLLSNFAIFWIGLISAFVWAFILNIKFFKGTEIRK
jgi:putative flippase GtrA